MSERELNKVRLESISSASEDEEEAPATASAGLDFPEGYESAVSDEGEVEVDYAVDAIKYAVYRNSKKDRSDGYVGWHYHVMWSGFLKTGSDTEEPVRNFARGGQVLPEFWKTYNGASVPKNRREPPGRIGDQHESPDELLKKWFLEARPQRDFDAYNRRRTRLEQNKVQVLKADSDYYIHKARLAQKVKQSQSETDQQRVERKAKEKAQRKAERKAARRAARLAEERAQAEKNARVGSKSSTPAVPLSATSATGTKGKGKAKRIVSPNVALSSPESVKRERNPTPPANAVAGPSKLPTPPRHSPSRATSPADSLDILNSDHEVDAVLGNERIDRESSEMQEEVDVPVSAGTQGSKRKRILSSPAPPEPLSLGEKETKKSKPEDKPPDDPPPTATTAAFTSSKSDRLAAMGKIPKRIWVPGGDTNLEGMSTGRSSEVFGSPQAGIFDAVETEEEEEPIEDRRDRDDLASDKDSLFGGYEDDEMDEPTAPVSAVQPRLPEQANSALPSETPTSIKPLSIKPIKLSTVQPVPPNPPASQPAAPVKVSVTANLPARQAAAVPASLPPPPSVSHFPPVSTRTTGSDQAGPSTTVAPVVRPKYVQPSKLKLMEGLSDPERAKLIRRAGAGGQPQTAGTDQVHVHRALQPSMGGVSPVNPTGGQSPLHPTSSFIPPPPPTGPAAFRPRPTQSFVPRAIHAAGPPPPPFGLISQPPRNVIPPAHPAGLMPQAPAGPRGWNSASMPGRPPPTGLRLGGGAISPSGGLSPMGTMSPGSYDTSPVMQQAELAPAHVPIVTPAYNAAADPRRARNPQQHPPPSETAPPPPSTAAPPPPPPPPPYEAPAPPLQRPSIDQGVPGQHEITATCRLLTPIPADGADIACGIRLLRGTPSTTYRELSLQGFLARDKFLDVWCETLDAFCLTAHLGYGATIVEWAKVIPVDREAKGPYADLKRLAFSETDPKIFATYTDTGPHRIDRHYAIVVAGSHIVDFEALGLDLGHWHRAEMGLVALLVSLPLDSQPPPALPNPVKPEIEIRVSKPHPLMLGSCDLLDSFGLSSGLLSSFGGKFVQYRPGHKEGPLDDFFHGVKAGFKSVGVKHIGDKLDTFLIENARLFTAIRSTTMGNALPRRTTIMAMGPTLSLLPSQWKARTIWSNGGLVTFSPTFILRSPDKFAEIMRVIRPANSWAAYIVPSVVEWASMSWNEPTRCPDSTRSFECLTRSLFLDQHLLRFSGSAASSGGGLAVSIAPPSIHQTDLCIRWSNWLRQTVDESYFNTLVDLCRGIRPGSFASLPSTSSETKDDKKTIPTELELVDIERSQIEDLVAMRMRPDLLPYRRYIYVGEMSLDRRTRDLVSGKGVEFISPDDFVAVFSGAV